MAEFKDGRVILNKHYNNPNKINKSAFSDDIIKDIQNPQNSEIVREGELIICTDNNNPGIYIYTASELDANGNISKEGKIVRLTSPDSIKLTSAYVMSNLETKDLKVVSGQTLEEAISILDKLISAKTSTINENINTIRKSIGLDADGKHITTNGNYTNTANSIVSEIDALDKALKNVDDSYISNITVNNINTEIQNKHAYITINGKQIKLSDYFSGTTYSAISSDDTINSAFAKLENGDRLIKEELDNTQKGSGLDIDGSYIQQDKIYIKDAVSLADADAKLNDAIENIRVQASSNTVSSPNETILVKTGDNGTEIDVNIDYDTIDSVDGILTTNLSIKKYTDGLDANIREAFALVSGDGTELGNRINVYKDSSLYKVELGKTSWKIDKTTGEYTEKGENGNDALVFIYQIKDGTYSIVTIDIAEYLKEVEFGSGLKVENGNVSIESINPDYLIINENSIGIKVGSINDSTKPEDGLVTAYDAKTYADKLMDMVVGTTEGVNDWTVNGYKISDYVFDKPVILDGYDIKLSFEDLNNPNRVDHDKHSYTQSTASGSSLNISSNDTIANAIAKITQNIDIIQIGAGLNNVDGSYSKDINTNYINNALSLKDADNKLDTAIKTEVTNRENAISGLEEKINNIYPNVGLSNSGAYIKNNTSNYISEATSLNDADNKLDAAIKAEVTNRESSINSLSENISNLTKSVNSSFDTVNGSITTLTNNTSNSINNLDKKIDNEVSEITKITNNLSIQINEINNTTISALDSKIDTEVTNRTNSVNDLQKNINNLSTSFNTSITGLNTKIDKEIEDRGKAITAIEASVTELSEGVSNNYLSVNGGTMHVNAGKVINMDADKVDGLDVNDVNNSTPDSLVRTDNAGYIRLPYIYYNIHDKKDEAPSYICGFNNTDNYIRSYTTNKLSVESASKLTTNAGSTTKPVYFRNGVPTECGFNIETNVPKNAVFTDTTYNNATQINDGLMSSTDKNKLDGIKDGANVVTFSRGLTNGTKIGTLTINDIATDLYCETNTDTTYTSGNGIELNGNTFSHADTSTLNGAYGPTEDIIGNDGATIVVPQITVDGYGHITGITNRTYTSVNTDTNTTYTNGNGIDLNGTVFSHADTSTLEGSYGPTSDVIGNNGEKIVIPQITVDGYGHITGITNRTYESVNTDTNTDTTYSSGDGIELNGTVFSHADTSTLEGSYGPTEDVTGDDGATIVVPQITVDGYGHITGITNRTYKSVNTDTNTDTNNYLTKISGNGNSTVTFEREGLSDLTWDASHTHNYAASTTNGGAASKSYVSSFNKGVKYIVGVDGDGNQELGIHNSNVIENGSGTYIGTDGHFHTDAINLFSSDSNSTITGTYEPPIHGIHCGYIYNTGATNSYGGFFDTSDERMKDFSGDIEVDFVKLKSIPKKYFTWKEDDEKVLQIGTSAQAVENVYPELINELPNGTKLVAYNKLSIIALKAVDILYEENKQLKERIEKIEAILENLLKK